MSKNKKKINPSVSDFKDKYKVSTYLLFLILIPMVLYIKSVGFQFTKFDDTDIILRHYDTIKDLKNIPLAFKSDFYLDTTGTSFYRPIPAISFMLDSQIGGEEPWIYHFSNLIIHIITTLVLFFFFYFSQFIPYLQMR